MSSMNIPVSDFFKGQLHTQITLPMHCSRVEEEIRQDFSQHNLTLLNLWLSKTESGSHHSEAHENHSAEMVRIEQKLDLIINLFQQLLASETGNNLNLITVLISVGGISWMSADTPLEPGDAVLIELALDSGQAPLRLYASIEEIESLGDTILCTARFELQNEEVLTLLEKWIFNMHRREIANIRQK